MDDFERAARRRLPRPLYGYVSGAAEDNASAEDNRHVFSEFGFTTRSMRDVSARSQSVQLFGRRYSSPFGIAPMGLCALSTYQGDLVIASAAKEAGIPSVLSGASLTPLETVADAAPGTWFQMYIPARPDDADRLVGRVAAAGYDTLVVTVDVQVPANRENNVRAGFATPLRVGPRLLCDFAARPRWFCGTLLRTLTSSGLPRFVNGLASGGVPLLDSTASNYWTGRDHLDHRQVERVRRLWDGRLIVKGLLSVQDVLQAREIGADAVILSNHGGRQLDGAVSAMRVLPSAVEAVGADFPILIDGGFRRGSDVLKALALGARMALIGRPFNYAAAAAGKRGVTHAISLLKAEIDRNLAMLGATDCRDLNGSILVDKRSILQNQFAVRGDQQ
ncbi:alpha-hydroxy acid oxidase [Methylobacterium sp. NEAU 140]|uniref:alpha-hydroxy acid oxidase n=1 Tax=Methylobacterium sp. NEAU 140 TaxID=3064945 RepID=UPI002736402E|nr:alpha-hydroxy acid oxidase [Methylobacterium sp. NEAU 140]MDP4026588.1 alpha-hydroxy acid oxidase [Methylobacterium sp. NEAU 140]